MEMETRTCAPLALACGLVVLGGASRAEADCDPRVTVRAGTALAAASAGTSAVLDGYLSSLIAEPIEVTTADQAALFAARFPLKELAESLDALLPAVAS